MRPVLDKDLKRLARLRVMDLLDEKCRGCPKNKESPQCQTDCQVGQELIKLRRLILTPIVKAKKVIKPIERRVNTMPAIPIMTNLTPADLTEKKYLEHKKERISDREIMKMYGFKNNVNLTEWKRNHNLIGVKVPSTNEEDQQQPKFVSDTPETTFSQLKEQIAELAGRAGHWEGIAKQHEQHLQSANQARLNAEAKAEQLQREIEGILNANDLEWFDARVVALELLQAGSVTIKNRDEAFQMINVLEAMNLPWAADYDSVEYTIRHKCL